MRDDVQQELQEKGFANMILATNRMRRNIQTIVDTVESKFQNRITSKDENFIQSTIHQLIYLEKPKLVWHKKVKESIGTRQTKVGRKIK